MRLRLSHFAVMAIVLIAAALATEGLRTMRVADTMPAYTDPRQARSLTHTMPDEFQEYRENAKAFTRRWHEKMEALRTNKWEVYDRGRTMIVLSICVIGAVLLFRLWRKSALANLRTPSRRVLVLLGAATYASVVPAYWVALFDQQRREYLPWWADSIGLPGSAILFLVLMTLPIVFLLLWLCVRRANLPSSLWAFDAARPVVSTVVSLFFGGAALALAGVLVEEAWQGAPYFILWLVCSIYGMLCLRAALLAPRADDTLPLKELLPSWSI